MMPVLWIFDEYKLALLIAELPYQDQIDRESFVLAGKAESFHQKYLHTSYLSFRNHLCNTNYYHSQSYSGAGPLAERLHYQLIIIESSKSKISASTNSVAKKR